jgi:hypothetical protein
MKKMKLAEAGTNYQCGKTAASHRPSFRATLTVSNRRLGKLPGPANEKA